MKGKNLALLILSIIATSMLASCSGGGASGVLSAVPDGDYYRITGFNPVKYYSSTIFRDLADELDPLEKAAKDWKNEMDDMGLRSENSNRLQMFFQSSDMQENLLYFAGPFRADDLEDFYEDEVGWSKWSEDDKNNKIFYTGDVVIHNDTFSNYQKREETWDTWNSDIKSNRAFYLNKALSRALDRGTFVELERSVYLGFGGFFEGTTDGVQDIIKVMSTGKKRLTENKKFREARKIVDFNATAFSLLWDDTDDVERYLKAALRKVDDDEDILETLDDIEAISTAFYYSGKYRVSIKLLLGDREDVKTLALFCKDETGEILEKVFPSYVHALFGNDANTEDLDDLARNVKIKASGKVMEMTLSLSWKELENIVD